MQVPPGKMQQQGGPGFQNVPQSHGGPLFPPGQSFQRRLNNQKTTFKYFQFRKPTSRDLETGIKPSWSLATYSEVSIPSAEIEEKVRKIRAQSNKSTRRGSVDRTAIDDYDDLPSSNMRDKVDELLHKHMREERDPTMEWSIAAIETEKRALDRARTEVSCMRLYIKRSLRPEFANVNRSGSINDLQQSGPGFPPQVGGFNGQQAIQAGQMGQKLGGPACGPGGFLGGPPVGPPGGPPVMPGPVPGPPGARVNLPGPPFPVNVTQVNKSGKKKDKDGKKSNGKGKINDRSRSRSRSKGERKSKKNYSSEDDDSYDDYSDASSDSGSNSSRGRRRNRNDRKWEDAKFEMEELQYKFDRLARKNSAKSLTKARRMSSHSQLPPVPIGQNRRTSQEYVPQRKPSWEQRDRQYLPNVITSVRPNPQKVAMVERIHYHDDSDVRDSHSEGSGPSISSWVGGQSAFSRPPSDVMYTPPESPRSSRDDFRWGNLGYAFREHKKPGQNAYGTPPISPRDVDDRHFSGRGRDRRGARDYLNNYRHAPEYERRNTYPALVEGAGDYFDHGRSRSKSRDRYDSMRRQTAEAVDHIVAKMQAERERSRRRDRDRARERSRSRAGRYRRVEEDRYNDDHYDRRRY